jgi:hypothetical protein
MKKHLNTLFVTTQGAYLAKDGKTVAVKVDQNVNCLLSFIYTLMMHDVRSVLDDQINQIPT